MRLPFKIFLTCGVWMFMALAIGAAFDMPPWWLIPAFFPVSISLLVIVWTGNLWPVEDDQ